MANKDRLDNLNNRFDSELLNMINQLVPYEKPAGNYVWKKLTTEGGELIDYVISDDPSAYPDKGYVGQYWYELHDGEGQYVWKKLTTEGGDFVDYVVADDALAFPNGGTQDDFYYELLSNPVDLAKELDLIPQNIREGVNIFDVIGIMSEGVSGIDFGEVTASNASSLSITHNLKVTPKRCILISISQTLASNIVNMIYQSSEVIYSDRYSAAYGGVMYNDWVYKDKCVNATYGATYTSETITFKSPSTTNKFTGTYIWIAIA